MLLLFDGHASTREGYFGFEGIGSNVRRRWGDLVTVHVVVPMRAAPADLHWDGPVLLDTDGALHRRYGAGAECLYLVRPDGYVGFRSQPVDAGALVAHLDRIFATGA